MAQSFGIDLTTVTSYTTSYGGYFDTPLYTVGSNKNLRAFQEMEFQLVRPLRINEGIKFQYRTNLTASFSDIGTYSYLTLGAKVSHNFVIDVSRKILACEQIQFRISLTGTTTSPGLKSVTLR